MARAPVIHIHPASNRARGAAHRLTPAARGGALFILADWFVLPPRQRISAARSVIWLAFPLVWTIYTLIRGAVSGRYPYPFLDPANGGYANVTVYMVVILVFMLLLALGVAATSRRRALSGGGGQ